MRFLIPLTLAAAAGVGLIAIPDAHVFDPPAPPSAKTRPAPDQAGDGPKPTEPGSQLRLRLASKQTGPEHEQLVADSGQQSADSASANRPIQRLLENSRRVLDQVLHKTTGKRTSPPRVDQYGKHPKRSSRRRTVRPSRPQPPAKTTSHSSKEKKPPASLRVKEPRQSTAVRAGKTKRLPHPSASEKSAAFSKPQQAAGKAPSAHGELYVASEPTSELTPFSAVSRNERPSPEQLRRIIRQLDRRIGKHPADATLYAMRGKAYAHLGQFARALQDLELAVALDPQLAEAYGNRGLIHYRQGKLKQALADFHQVVRLQPQLAKGYLDRAKVYYKLGNLRKALRDASEALRRDTRLVEARRLRAAALLRLGKPALAAQEAHQGLMLAPWNNQLRQLLALAEASAGHYDRALTAEQAEGPGTEPEHWLLATWHGVRLPQQIALLEEKHFPAPVDRLVLNARPGETARQAAGQPQEPKTSLSLRKHAPAVEPESTLPLASGQSSGGTIHQTLPKVSTIPGTAAGQQPHVVHNPFIAGQRPHPAPEAGAVANTPSRLKANKEDASSSSRAIRLVIHDTETLSRPQPFRKTGEATPKPEAQAGPLSPKHSSRRRRVSQLAVAPEAPPSPSAPANPPPAPEPPAARLKLVAEDPSSGANRLGAKPVTGHDGTGEVRVQPLPSQPASRPAHASSNSSKQTQPATNRRTPQVAASVGQPTGSSSRRRRPGVVQRIAPQPHPERKSSALQVSIREAAPEPPSAAPASGVPRLVAAVAAEEAEFTLPVSHRMDLAPPLRLVLPEQLPALREATSKTLLQRARQRFLQGDLESARDMYDVIVRLEPQSALARSYRALIHWRLGQLEQAQADAQWAQKQNPRIALAPAVLALVQQAQGKTEASWKAIQQAQRLAPQCRPIALQAAATLLHLGQSQQALKLLQPILRAAAQDPWAQLYASMAWAQQKQYDKALAAVEKALKLWPQWPRALHQRAAIALRQHRLQQAIDDWTVVLKLQPNHVPSRLQRAEAFYQAQRWAEAVEDLSVVLKLQPNHHEARRRRAEALYRLKAYSEALKDCRRLLASKEKRAEDRLLLARVLLALRHHDQALEELTQAESQGLRKAELYYLRALALEERGEAEAALADYTEALKRDPTHVQAGLNQVRLLLSLDRAAEAVKRCRQLLQQGAQPTQVRLWLAEALLETDQTQEAIEHLQQALDQAPKKKQRAKAHRLLAVAYARSGQVEKSQKAFRKALALEPDSAEIYLHRGLLALEQDKLEQALDDLQTACRLAPEDPRCRLARAMALERKGLYSQALADLNWLLRHRRSLKAHLVRARIYVAQNAHQLALEDLNRAVELNPRYAEAYRLRAALHLKLNRNAEALKDVKQALQYEPEDAELLTIQGEALRRQGKLQQAVEVLDRAIRLDAKLAPAWISRGMAHLNQGKAQQALKDLDRAVELVAENPRAYLQRGIIHAHLGNYEQAAQDFEQAIELAPTDAKAYAYRAMVALKQGEYQDAVDYYTEALRFHPRYALAYYERGKAHWLLGDENKALADYQRAVELNPIYAGAFYDEP